MLTIKNSPMETSLVADPNAGGMGSIPGWGSRVPRAARWGQIYKIIIKKKDGFFN